MLKYFRNKPVHVQYEYNDSLGGHAVREAELRYTGFEIKARHGSYSADFQVKLLDGQTVVWQQELGTSWEFEGLGQLTYINSGPRCHFTIKG